MSNFSDGKHEDLPVSDVGRLVQQARSGELGAFDVLVGRYQRQATAVAYRLLNNLDDAMEVTQDAFLRAYDKLGLLSKPAQFGPWLMRIVSNLALNRRRARALRSAVSIDAAGADDDREISVPDDAAESPLEAASAKEMETVIDKILSDLPEMQRKALVMFSVAKMPQKEVAKMLGCSVEAVKWHVFTARKKLKDRLRDYL